MSDISKRRHLVAFFYHKKCKIQKTDCRKWYNICELYDILSIL